MEKKAKLKSHCRPYKCIRYRGISTMEMIHVTNKLISAVYGGRLHIVRELINTFGLSYSREWSEGYVLLCDALQRKHTKIVELLLAYNAKVNIYQELSDTPLHFAVRNGDVKIVKMLLDRGANIDAKAKNDNMIFCPLLSEGFTPLHVAVRNCKREIVKLLLSRGANVDATDTFGATSLHYAVEMGYLQIDVLLKFGADVDSEDIYGRTALHLAVQKGRLEVVKILLKFGVSIESKDKYGRTALHNAVIGNQLEMVEGLLELGADIEAKDKSGRTALHCAFSFLNTEIIETLLEHGSDINIQCKDGIPYNFAMDRLRVLHYDNPVPDFYFNRNEFCFLRNCILCKDSDKYCKFNSNVNYYYVITVIKNLYKILNCHINKMIIANLHVSKENLLSIHGHEIHYRDFQEKCKKEIASMKREKVNDTNVTFYDILTKNINKLERYAGNENILQALKSDDYKIKFPLYAKMISNRFRKGEKRRELLEQSNEIFDFFRNNFKLTQECIEKIFSYISNKDLEILSVNTNSQ